MIPTFAILYNTVPFTKEVPNNDSKIIFRYPFIVRCCWIWIHLIRKSDKYFCLLRSKFSNGFLIFFPLFIVVTILSQLYPSTHSSTCKTQLAFNRYQCCRFKNCYNIFIVTESLRCLTWPLKDTLHVNLTVSHAA